MSAVHYEMRSRSGRVVQTFDNRARAAMASHGVPCRIVRVARLETEIANTLPAASPVPPQEAQPVARIEAARDVKGCAS